jgi:hypothetical protein
MIGDTVAVTYNAIVKTLNKINQDNYGSNYFLDDAANLMKFTLTVKHTIPPKGKFGESHLARLDVDHYDASSVLLRTATAWGVIKTDNGNQDSTSSSRVALALQTFMTSTNIGKLVGRES